MLSSASSSSSPQWHLLLMLKDFSLKGHVLMHFLPYSYFTEEFLKNEVADMNTII